MTIGSDAWVALEHTCSQCFLPNCEKPELPEQLRDLTDIQLYCVDAMQPLRSIPTGASEDVAPGSQPGVVTCHSLLERIASSILSVLQKGDVDTYVYCLDPYGKSRPEKAATAADRRKQSEAAIAKGAQERVELPPGQQFYYEDHCPPPASMDVVFRTPEARRSLYHYVCSFLRSEEFYSRIPDGKCVVLSGGLALRDGVDEPHLQAPIQLPPLEMRNSGQRLLESGANHVKNISEADLSVWFWVRYYPKKTALVYSGDGDVLLAGLIQMRMIFRNNPHRRVWFQTRRSGGTAERPGEFAEYVARMYGRYQKVLEESDGDKRKKAYRASHGITRPVPIRTNTTVWAHRYVDLHRMWAFMLNDANDMNETAGSVLIHHAVEQWVVLMALASQKHDYMKRSLIARQVGARPLWLTYLDYRHLFGSLVRVYASEDHSVNYYVVDTCAVRRLVSASYFTAAVLRSGPRSATYYEKLQMAKRDPKYRAKLLKSTKASRLKYMPSEDEMRVGCAQLAWVLDYYSNDIRSGVADGMRVDSDDGLSVSGFVRDGFADAVSAENLRCARQIPDQVLDDIRRQSATFAGLCGDDLLVMASPSDDRVYEEEDSPTTTTLLLSPELGAKRTRFLLPEAPQSSSSSSVASSSRRRRLNTKKHD